MSTITNQTLTLTITSGTVETVIRKDNCRIDTFGDYVRLTDYTGERYEFLYSDVSSPSSTSATDLAETLEGYLNTGGGGGGGGVESVTGDSVDNTDPNNPVVNAIPLTGTAESAPLTGVIEVQSGYLAQWTSGDIVTRVGFNEDGDFSIERKDLITNAVSQLFLSNPSGTPQVNSTASDGTINSVFSTTVDEGVSKQLFNSERIGFFDKATTVNVAPQAAAIADATNSSDVITQFNTLLAAMRAYGLIAE